MHNAVLRSISRIFIAATVCCSLGSLSAQVLRISSQPDFSQQSTTFSFTDSIYVDLHLPGFDFTILRKMRYKLEGEGAQESSFVEGRFQIRAGNKIFTAIALDALNVNISTWELEIKVTDVIGREFKSKIPLRITVDGGSAAAMLHAEGAIASPADGCFTLNGLRFCIDANTVIRRESDHLRFEDLQHNWRVEVSADKFTNGAFRLTHVDVTSTNAENRRIEIEGRLLAVSDSVIYTGSLQFRVLPEARIQNRDEQPIALDALRSGMRIDVEGFRSPAGNDFAEKIRLRDDKYIGEKVEGRNQITALFADGNLPDSVQLGPATYIITSTSRLYGFEDELISATQLVAGERMEFEAEITTGIAVLKDAYRIKEDDAAITIDGRIDALNASMLSINSYTVNLTAFSRLLSESLQYLPISQLTVGHEVSIHAESTPNGSLNAGAIFLVDAESEAFSVRDFISEIDNQAIVASGLAFLIDDRTEIYDRNGDELQFSELALNDILNIKAVSLTADQFRAIEIERELNLNHQIVLEGFIEASQSGQFQINSLIVETDDDTDFEDDCFEKHNQVNAGELVKVTASLTGNALRAEKIECLARVEDAITVTAAISRTNADTLFIFDIPFYVPSSAIVLAEDGEKIDFRDLKVGELVELIAVAHENAAPICWQVKRVSGDPATISIRASVISIGGAILSTNFLNIFSDAQTEVTNAQGETISLKDLRSGGYVEIHARAVGPLFIANEVLVANRQTLSGKIDTADAAGVSLLDQEIAFESPVLLISENGIPSSGMLPGEGSIARVAYEKDADGRATAQYIRLIAPTLTTSVRQPGGRAILPSQLRLLPTAPNPISLSELSAGGTLLQFELKQQQAVNLHIFNILGQEVAALLVERQLQAGQHQTAWNGLNSRNQILPAGVYFVRLSSGSQQSIQRLLILP